jgi:stage II sporulation protein D
MADALPASVRVRVAGRVVTVPFERYVLGTALSEVSPVGENPATTARVFEVQAILARTYAAATLDKHRAEGFNLCDDTHCQLYEPGRITTSRFSSVAEAAVARTRGMVLTYGSEVAEALFHSDCGGHTATAGDVWTTAIPYLIGAPDDLPTDTHLVWQFDMAASRLRTALNLDRQTQVGRRLDAIAVVRRDTSGRAATIEVRGEQRRTSSGEAFRAILNRTFGVRAIRSTRFSVRRTGTTYHFSGTGFGHGVGLCQVGAAARARRGDAVADILRAYFPGTTLSGM